MPDDLKNFISTSATEHQKDNMVWFSCEGENPADIEHIGEIEWYPSPGVPKYFFPYTNQDGYLSPIVFAHFKNPKRKWINSFRKHDVYYTYSTFAYRGSAYIHLLQSMGKKYQARYYGAHGSNSFWVDDWLNAEVHQKKQRKLP